MSQEKEELSSEDNFIVTSIFENLKKTTVSEINLTDYTLHDAVNLLSEKYNKRSSRKKMKVPFIVSSENGFSQQKIHSLRLKNVSLIELLKSICLCTNSGYKITQNSISIYPNSSNEKIYTASFKFTPNMHDYLHKVVNGEYHLKKIPNIEPVEILLKKAGIPFPEGTSVTYSKENSLLSIKSYQRFINATELIINIISGNISNILPADIHENFVNGGNNSIKKLKQIVIPSFEVNNMTLEQSLESLRLKTIQADSDIKNKGVNFIIVNNDISQKVLPANEIFSNASVIDIIKSLTKNSDIKYSIEDYAVIFSPKSQDERIVESFIAPKKFYTTLLKAYRSKVKYNSKFNTSKSVLPPLRELLEQLDVISPDDPCHITYFSYYRVVMIHGEPEKIDSIKKYICSLK